MSKSNLALSRLQHAFDRLEASRKRMQRLAQAAPETVLNRRSPTGGWSPLQIMHHLILAETASCDYLEKKLQAPIQAKRAGWRAWARFLALYMALQSPIKFKAPAIIAGGMPETANLSETIEKWNAVRTRLQAIIKSIPAEHLHQELFKHPVAGKMSVLHMLRFMNIHTKRHILQMKKTIKR